MAGNEERNGWQLVGQSQYTLQNAKNEKIFEKQKKKILFV